MLKTFLLVFAITFCALFLYAGIKKMAIRDAPSLFLSLGFLSLGGLVILTIVLFIYLLFSM